MAKLFVDTSLKASAHMFGATRAEACELFGHILLELALPSAALDAYLKARDFFQVLEGYGSSRIATLCDLIAWTCTELGEVNNAFKSFASATGFKRAQDSTETTVAIRSIACLRAGAAEDALASLREFWRLRGATQEEIEDSQEPEDSGDIMLLARIFRLQGKLEDACNLCKRTIALRRPKYGATGGPRLADSLFFLSQLLDAEGKPDRAIAKLQEIVEMRPEAPEMRPHRARAYWFLANAKVKMGVLEDSSEVTDARKAARGARSGIERREWQDEDTDEGYMRLVPFLLW